MSDSISDSTLVLLFIFINIISVNEPSRKYYCFDFFSPDFGKCVIPTRVLSQLKLEPIDCAWIRSCHCLLLTWSLIFVGRRKKETRRTWADHGRKQQKNWRSPEETGNYITDLVWNSSCQFVCFLYVCTLQFKPCYLTFGTLKFGSFLLIWYLQFVRGFPVSINK